MDTNSPYITVNDLEYYGELAKFFGVKGFSASKIEPNKIRQCLMNESCKVSDKKGRNKKTEKAVTT